MSDKIELTLNEARVLGVLIEKEKTVPDTYPMSVNAILSGANQKTARDPVMALSESEVVEAIEGLKRHTLLAERSGGRVMKYAQNARKGLHLPEQSVAVLAVLMLRGAQTSGELRLNCDRIYSFGDISSVDAFLDEMAASEQCWVVKLPKQPGAREHRWVHQLCGEIDAESYAQAPAVAAAGNANLAQVYDEIDGLRAEVALLKQQLQHIQAELGME